MINLKEYGYLDSYDKEKEEGSIPARVLAAHKERYELICEFGRVYGRLKSSIYFIGKEDSDFPTVGDFVLISYNESGDCTIVKTMHRYSSFLRVDPSSSGHREQAAAANFDYVFIVSSLNLDFNLKKLERYITAAWQSGALPVIVLTKADLEEDPKKIVREAEKIAPGVPVYAISATTGLGMEKLNHYMTKGKTIVFLGASGVGKSTLVNVLAGEELMKTNEIREKDSRGRHTTTHRQLVMLESGVMIIDTPGMRQLGMWDVSTGISESFLDVEDFIKLCRFSNCNHKNELGCAVLEAIESGKLSTKRWKNYLSLRAESGHVKQKNRVQQTRLLKAKNQKPKVRKNNYTNADIYGDE